MLFWDKKFFYCITNYNGVGFFVFFYKTVQICEIVAQRSANYIMLALKLFFFPNFEFFSIQVSCLVLLTAGEAESLAG